MFVVGDLGGVRRRLGLRVLDAALDVVEGNLEHLSFDVNGDGIQKGVNERTCGGGAARVEDIGELGHWSQERSRPGLAAVRRRSGAAGETFAESVPAVAEGDVGGAAEAVMTEFLAEKVFGFMVFP